MDIDLELKEQNVDDTEEINQVRAESKKWQEEAERLKGYVETLDQEKQAHSEELKN